MSVVSLAFRGVILFSVPWGFYAAGVSTLTFSLFSSTCFIILEIGLMLRLKSNARRSVVMFGARLFFVIVIQIWGALLNVSMQVKSNRLIQDLKPGSTIDRSVPDLKPHFFELDPPPESLRSSPQTISVVLPCAQEQHFALKTVESVYYSTPSHILYEIIVVDDGSDPPLSTTYLAEPVRKQYKVEIKRHEETVGLIGAKKTGGDAARGDIIVFFDCHVAPQKDWYKDFLELIAVNYRRVVVPGITDLDITTWQQAKNTGAASKCYLTFDGDFKWGGTGDMYMGMLSGGLAGMSRRWWNESGGFDNKMLGWGGENIDQGIRTWVCGGEIVKAQHSQVAHMWRDGTEGTMPRYRHVGDTFVNRARAVNAWMGKFVAKLDDFPEFRIRRERAGENWFGDMSHYDEVKRTHQGCYPFAWYLRRFKSVYEDAGVLPFEIFMLKVQSTDLCLLYEGEAGTSGAETIPASIDQCDEDNHRFFWHLGNRNEDTKTCCSGIRAWNTDMCIAGAENGKGLTIICEISGGSSGQQWALTEDGWLRNNDACLSLKGPNMEIIEIANVHDGSCAKFTKTARHEPLEYVLYQKEQKEHPEVFAKLNVKLQALANQLA